MPERYRRPAEAQLPSTLRALREDLYDGFLDRDAVLLWLQEMAVSTLGQVSSEGYASFAVEFRPDSEYDEGVLLAAFLQPHARTRDLEDGIAQRVRQQWAAEVLSPVQSDAFRSLRKDAGEYVGETQQDEENDPGESIDYATRAMRPALEELHGFQQSTLMRLLDGELDDRASILDWGDDLVLATRGEPIYDGRPPGELIRDLHNDPSGDKIMCDTRPHWVRHRQTWVCHQILPAFNRAVQDLTRRTAEEPAVDNSSGTGETPGW